MMTIVYIAAGILAIITGFFIFSIARQQRKLVKWQQACIAAEINRLEEERKRIAGDLHDDLGPLLSAVRLQINHLEPSAAAEKALLEKTSSQIDDIIRRIREISYNLLPNVLVRKGFINATQEFVEKMAQLHPLKIHFEPDAFSLAAEREISLYRIVQEMIHNAIRHSGAEALWIKIRKQEKILWLTASDDGAGFDYPGKLLKGETVGLMSLHSRARLLGGHLKVTTGIGKGTTFELEIPLTQ